MCQIVNVFCWSYLLKQKGKTSERTLKLEKRILDILHCPVINQIFKTRVRTNISSERSCYSFFSWNALHRHLLGHDSNIFLSLHKLPDSSKIISSSSWKCLKCRHAGFFKKGFVLASPSIALFSLCGWPTIPKSVLLIEAFINGEAPPSWVPHRFFLLSETSQLTSGIGGSQCAEIPGTIYRCAVWALTQLPSWTPYNPACSQQTWNSSLIGPQSHRSTGYWSNDLGPLTPAKPKQEVKVALQN